MHASSSNPTFVISGEISHGLSETSICLHMGIPLHLPHTYSLSSSSYDCAYHSQLSPLPILHSIFPTHLTSLSLTLFFFFHYHSALSLHTHPSLSVMHLFSSHTLWLSFQTGLIPEQPQIYIQTLPIIFGLFKLQVYRVKCVRHSKLNSFSCNLSPRCKFKSTLLMCSCNCVECDLHLLQEYWKKRCYFNIN